MSAPRPETILWHDPADELPDADTTVLIDTWDGDPWPGWWDGEGWYFSEGNRPSGTVIAWAHMPEGTAPLPAQEPLS